MPTASLSVPDEPIIPYVEGDGTGVDIWPAAQLVMDAAAAKHGKKIAWKEVLAGREGVQRHRLVAARRDRRHLPRVPDRDQGPADHADRRRHPLAQRRAAPAARPLRVPAPGALVPGRAVAGEAPRSRRHGDLPGEHRRHLRRASRSKRERPRRTQLIALLKEHFGWNIRADSGVGIKPISETGSKRLIRAAIKYAIENDRKSVTLVHKGNIQKFTEGAFMKWGYELVREEFADVAVGWDDCGGKPGDKVLVKDSIADITLQQVLTRPEDFDVIATTNLNGDYLSDALAAQVGGIGIAPGGNINYVTGHGIFEATHGTAPKYAGQDKVNPSSVLLSGVMMFDHLGWTKAARDIERAIEATIADKVVTYDFARLMEGATEVKTSEFAQAIVDRL